MFCIKLSDCRGNSGEWLQFQTLSSVLSLWTGFLTDCFNLDLCVYAHSVSALFDASLPVLKLFFKVWSQIGPYQIIHCSPPCMFVCLVVYFTCVWVCLSECWCMFLCIIYNMDRIITMHAGVFVCRGTVLWKFVLDIQQLFCNFLLDDKAVATRLTESSLQPLFVVKFISNNIKLTYGLDYKLAQCVHSCV